mgnify:CR=1 FL=1
MLDLTEVILKRRFLVTEKILFSKMGIGVVVFIIIIKGEKSIIKLNY